MAFMRPTFWHKAANHSDKWQAYLRMEDKICRVARFSFLLSGTKTSSDLWNMEIHLMSAQYSTNRGNVFIPHSEGWQSLSSESILLYLFSLYYTAKSGKPSFRKRQSLSS